MVVLRYSSTTSPGRTRQNDTSIAVVDVKQMMRNVDLDLVLLHGAPSCTDDLESDSLTHAASAGPHPTYLPHWYGNHEDLKLPSLRPRASCCTYHVVVKAVASRWHPCPNNLQSSQPWQRY